MIQSFSFTYRVCEGVELDVSGTAHVSHDFPRDADIIEIEIEYENSVVTDLVDNLSVFHHHAIAERARKEAAGL